MANDLNGIGADHLVIVNTYDEPAANRTAGGLDAALYRCGASPGVFGGTFRYRSAYILVGRCGYGAGSGEEFYSGDQDSDPTAAVEYGFEIRDGVWIR